MATAKRLQKLKSKYDEYPDDIFKDTRMSFGDHIEELRVRLIRALKWLMFFLLIGFVLDGIGQAVGNPRIGIGKPMLKVITDPVEEQVRDFYNRRINKVWAEKMAQEVNTTPDEIRRIQEKLEKNDYNLTALTSEERAKLRISPEKMPVIMPTAPLAEVLGLPSEKVKQQEVQLDAQVIPARLTYLTVKGEGLLENKQYLSTLSVQEGFVVYFKVSLLCGIVLASPFIFYQFWAFVGAGLYPHEKRYIYVFFGPSLGLFIAGILLCQFWVLPGAVKALLAFNEWLGFDPDIRLKEWLSLAIILPLVFGISFQTPLVMVFLNRIGMFTAQDYLSKWRHACFFLALFAAVITPTPDAVTMCYLFIPMFGLYMAGIVVCYMFPGFTEEDEEAEAAEEVAV
jgi:sec-independent protein translocase protein TatC